MSKVHVKTGDTVILLTGKDEYLYNDKDNKSKGRKTGKVVADPHGSGRRHCGNRRCTVRI